MNSSLAENLRYLPQGLGRSKLEQVRCRNGAVPNQGSTWPSMQWMRPVRNIGLNIIIL